MYDGFICDDCGFTSQEKTGEGHHYYCPKCGSKMRLANQQDANATSGIIILDILYFVFVGGISFGIMNYITYWTNDLMDAILFIVWLILFIVSLVYFHRLVSGSVRDKAVKKENM